MDNRLPSFSHRPDSLRPDTQRQRSNSFPIVEALGCSTPEAQLILAEGRAAVRKRRARGRQNRSLNDENITTFDPRNHMQYLHQLAALATPQERPIASESKISHTRFPSNATDQSTATIVPPSRHADSSTIAPLTSPLGDYSANLAQFIKAQLQSIPTYRCSSEATAPLSPRSCPDLSFPLASPPHPPDRVIRRPVEAPKVITIPPIGPPAFSAFSSWSSADDDTDHDTDDEAPLPDIESYSSNMLSKTTSYTPSVLGYYQTSNTSSFLFSSTPLEEDSEPCTAKEFKFPDPSALPGSSAAPQERDDYPSPSPSLSHPQLSSSSAPSYTSSASASSSSYFDCKRPTAITPSMKDRIIAAVTPTYSQDRILTAISPWEGGALTNVHNVYIESQQRIHVDGMSFDMLGNYVVPCGFTTPC